MSQKAQKFNDLTTEHTDNYSVTSRQQFHEPFINKIIESTQQIINNQAMKIFQLNNELKIMKKQNEILKIKYETLMKTFNCKQEIKMDDIIIKISELQNQLIGAKTQLAMCKAEYLELKFAGMKNQKSITIPQSLQLIKFPDIEKLKINLLTRSKSEKSDQIFSSSNNSEWMKLFDTYLSGYPRVSRFKQRTFDLVKKGLPHDLRESLWPIIFQNKVGITNNLYSELLNRKQKDVNYTKRVLSQINKDICRSFNGKTQFDSKVGLNNEVTEILQIFHMYRPDVSYVQGMTYPVIVLNLIVGKYKAFWIFCNLTLGNQFFRRLYTFESRFLSCYCRAFDLLLEQKLPKTAKLLVQRGIQSEVFLVQWFFTFFSRGLSYQFTLKIWDWLAYQGEILFYKLGLAIFELIQNSLLEAELEEPILVIREFSSYLTQQKLQKTIFEQKLTVQKFEKALQKVYKKQNKNQA